MERGGRTPLFVRATFWLSAPLSNQARHEPRHRAQEKRRRVSALHIRKAREVLQCRWVMASALYRFSVPTKAALPHPEIITPGRGGRAEENLLKKSLKAKQD